MREMINQGDQDELDDGDYRDYDNLADKNADDFDSSDDDEFEQEQLKECTFKPNINKSNLPGRTVEDLIDWGK